jgi:acyl transferase domain-containing protein
MAGRFPQADTLDEFWDIIESGRDVHEPVRSALHNIPSPY